MAYVEKPRRTKRDASITIRVAPPAVEALDALADAEQRSRSDMARILLGEALAERKRIEALAAPAPVAASSPPHPFRPQSGNALKCEECGGRIGDHR